MYAVKRRSARGTWRTAMSFGIGSNLGRRREGRRRRKRHPGPGTRPEGTRTGLVMSHVVAANGKAPITALGKDRRPSIVVKKQETRQRTASAVESRPDFLGPPPTAAAKTGSFLWTHAFRYFRASALYSPRARPKAAGRFAVELERGARLYRARAQLSISQRVRRAPPDAGPPVEKGALKHRAAGA